MRGDLVEHVIEEGQCRCRRGAARRGRGRRRPRCDVSLVSRTISARRRSARLAGQAESGEQGGILILGADADADSAGRGIGAEADPDAGARSRAASASGSADFEEQEIGAAGADVAHARGARDPRREGRAVRLDPGDPFLVDRAPGRGESRGGGGDGKAGQRIRRQGPRRQGDQLRIADRGADPRAGQAERLGERAKAPPDSAAASLPRRGSRRRRTRYRLRRARRSSRAARRRCARCRRARRHCRSDCSASRGRRA